MKKEKEKEKERGGGICAQYKSTLLKNLFKNIK